MAIRKTKYHFKKNSRHFRLGLCYAHDHGIDALVGCIQVEGKTQEAIKLVYADNDIVYVSIHSLHKISKYNGKDGILTKIYKLGSNAWKILNKTKARVVSILLQFDSAFTKRRLEKVQYAG
jgi:transcription-repair coupling factor (superfamily II helicase)